MTVLCWLQDAKRDSYDKVFSLYVPRNGVCVYQLLDFGKGRRLTEYMSWKQQTFAN